MLIILISLDVDISWQADAAPPATQRAYAWWMAHD